MKTRYFVMIRNASRDNWPLPLVDESEDVVLFDNEREANAAGLNNPLGNAYGFEIYPWPPEEA